MVESRVFVISGSSPIVTGDTKSVQLLPDKLPTLQEVVSSIKKELIGAGVNEWNASVEVELKIGTGNIIPGGSAGIKAKIDFKGKA